ncbi:hypothetical protein CFOL_v3_17241 [Cephalotus follicularis]|uniref:Uncharacterized protein n=1 Tax=Cephalotus follicularis TaxID=3775 RepID=A0A1Q3C0X0_CEPFO|nr:hypothetical protein CFOL_v3_17241 [Cephalotus follicularis]
MHDVFHISMLRRYIPDPSHVLDYDTVPVQDDLSCKELPVRILDRKMQTLRNRTISMVKVQWQFHKPDGQLGSMRRTSEKATRTCSRLILISWTKFLEGGVDVTPGNFLNVIFPFMM